jgi:hypothetical protein
MNAIFNPAVIARQDTANFHLKATHALTKRGIVRKDVIAEVLGIAEYTAKRLRKTPCPDHIREQIIAQRADRQQKQARKDMGPVWRGRIERWNRMIRRVWPDEAIPEHLGLMEIVSILKERGAWEDQIPSSTSDRDYWDEPFVNGPEAVASWRSNGLRNDVRELLADGLSQSDIARVLGRSKQIISYHAKATRDADRIQP